MAASDTKKQIIPNVHGDNRYQTILKNCKDAVSQTISLDSLVSKNEKIDIPTPKKITLLSIVGYLCIGIITGLVAGSITATVPIDSPGYIRGLANFLICFFVLFIATNKTSTILIALVIGLANYILALYVQSIPPCFVAGLTTGITCGIVSSLYRRGNMDVIKPIVAVYTFLSGDRYPDNKNDDSDHDDITKKVYRRLILRHTILNEIEGLSQQHSGFDELCSKYENGIPSPTTLNCLQQLEEKFPQQRIEQPHASRQEHPFILQPPGIRAYNLAVTDLFVEKALAYLNRKARLYSRQGFLLYTMAFLCMATSIFFALTNNINDNTFSSMISHENLAVHFLISGFVKSFTFYGLIILLAVYTARMGKTLFAQAEQMKDRRHALRQGRLFVHLKGGNVSIDELERAFNWNTMQDNAFNHLNTEAQAPWGNMLKEMMATLRETAKSSVELAKSVKKTD